MTEKCSVCGSEMEEKIPNSLTGEPMNNLGVEIYICTNPSCIRFMK